MKKIIIFLFIFVLMLNPVFAKSNFSLDDVEGLHSWFYAGKTEILLSENGFIVIPSNFDEMHEIYNNAKQNETPQFVTVDSVLHLSHIYFDYILRILETEILYDDLVVLTDRMIKLSEEQYEEAENPDVKNAAKLNIGFFSVAKKMFSPEYKAGFELDDLVNTELSNISSHEGLKARDLLTYVENPDLTETPYAFEDYSQYVPRGHYTRSEKLKNYFKAMMWYGRLDFKLKPGLKEQALQDGRMMALQSLLIVDALMKDDKAHQLWSKIYDTTAYFVGKSDDFDTDEYSELVEESFPIDANVDKYAENFALDKFIDKAMMLKAPKILSNFAFVDDGDTAISNKGFRFMGQRFIPDSYVFQELVFGNKNLSFIGQGKPFTMEDIPNAGPVRAFPRGLDFLAVLGSQRALEILEKEGDTDYEFYYEQLDKLRSEFLSITDEEWKENLYFRSIYSFLPLLERPESNNYPKFMLGDAWLNKELLSSLGSWTELRHDTILYAKQSYTPGVKSAMPKKPILTYGFVEPYPEVYKRIGNMMSDLRVKLSNKEIDLNEIEGKLESFEVLLSGLEEISLKELDGREITEKEYSVIRNIGEKLASLKNFPPEIMKKIAGEDVDSKMEIVADVHTEVNTAQVLEEGVGKPSTIYVIVEDKKGKRLCTGAVFSQYEFKHPLNDRLTDEKWQAMKKEKPAQAEWINTFTVK